MATVTKGRTFTSGETVTPAKLNDVVDLATVTDIQTADIADGQITTAKILDANVTDAKLATGIDASKLTTGTLPIARIADGAVVNDKLSLAANAGEIKKALNADNAPPIFACRAWVNFDGTRDTTGTVSTANTNRQIRASGNVSSVARNSVGDYTVVFTTAMPDANYATVTSTFPSSVASRNFASGPSPATAPTTTSVTVQIEDSNGVALDQSMGVAIFR
jgi:hypothetical protein